MSTSNNPRLKFFLLIGSLCKDAKMRTDDKCCDFEILNGVLCNWDQSLREGGMYKYSHINFVAGKRHTSSFNSLVDDHKQKNIPKHFVRSADSFNNG